MQFQSTRNSGHRVGLSEAIARGLAPDGGLYVPTELPGISLSRISARASSLRRSSGFRALIRAA